MFFWCWAHLLSTLCLMSLHYGIHSPTSTVVREVSCSPLKWFMSCHICSCAKMLYQSIHSRVKLFEGYIAWSSRWCHCTSFCESFPARIDSPCEAHSACPSMTSQPADSSPLGCDVIYLWAFVMFCLLWCSCQNTSGLVTRVPVVPVVYILSCCLTRWNVYLIHVNVNPPDSKDRGLNAHWLVTSVCFVFPICDVLSVPSEGFVLWRSSDGDSRKFSSFLDSIRRSTNLHLLLHFWMICALWC